MSLRSVLLSIEQTAKVLLLEVDLYARLSAATLRRIWGRPFYLREAIYQFDRIGVESLFIVALTGLFTGMVLALQGVALLTRFGATAFLGSMIGASIVRELGPVLAGLMLTGRVGSSIAAELGNMAVSEQIDAYRVEGTDVVRKLLVPRLLACLAGLPLLTVLADFIALCGGFVVIGASTDLTAAFYWHSVTDFLKTEDLLMGVLKPFCFGLIIASIAAHHGLRARGGAEAVGEGAKRAVVHASILILVADFFVTKLFLAVFPP